MVGQTVGKYRVVQRLGRGGMGTVYKAVDETLHREVAIKVLNPDADDTEVLKRFRAEALTLARLNHPNIATIYELTVHNDDLLMVMEFVRGESLDKVSERTGPMSFERAAHLCGQVLDALGHAHRGGIVHRDLKPANIMLADSGIVKVMDFGIARMAGTERLTIDGFMMGTPAYMAPEQVMGQEVDGRADLYSVGVVLYRLLTSHLPFKADTAIAMAQKQIKDPPTPLRQFRSELPLWCEQILNRALAKAPGDRYQTAEEFRAALTLSAALAPALEVTTVLPMPATASSSGRAQEDPEPVVGSEQEITVHPETVLLPVAAGALERPAGSSGSQVRQAADSAGLRRSRVRAGTAIAVLFVIAGVAGAILLLRREVPSVAPSSPVAGPPAPTTAEVGAGADSPDGRGASPAAAPAAKAVPAAPRFPTLAFTPVRVLVFSGTDAREREMRLQLGDTSLTVSGGQGAEQESKSVRYDSMIAIFQSRAREPRWVAANGAVNPVVRLDRGVFGFLKGNRDWLTIRTKAEFIPVRADQNVLERVAAALEERTGLNVIRTERGR